MTTPTPAALRAAEMINRDFGVHHRGGSHTPVPKRKIARLIDEAGMAEAVEVLKQIADLSGSKGETLYERGCSKLATALLAKLTK
jgi:hypothetical protein